MISNWTLLSDALAPKIADTISIKDYYKKNYVTTFIIPETTFFSADLLSCKFPEFGNLKEQTLHVSWERIYCGLPRNNAIVRAAALTEPASYSNLVNPWGAIPLILHLVEKLSQLRTAEFKVTNVQAKLRPTENKNDYALGFAVICTPEFSTHLGKAEISDIIQDEIQTLLGVNQIVEVQYSCFSDELIYIVQNLVLSPDFDLEKFQSLVGAGLTFNATPNLEFVPSQDGPFCLFNWATQPR